MIHTAYRKASYLKQTFLQVEVFWVVTLSSFVQNEEGSNIALRNDDFIPHHYTASTTQKTST
jgi:hypothetical protein